MSRPLYLILAMDCERIAAESPVGGPTDWRLSERAIRGFTDVVFAAGLKATAFIMPETAARHRDLLLDLEDKGLELGMHLHPQSFDDHRYTEYLGAYDLAAQKTMLREAAEKWTAALGRAPTAFRGGNLSANDATYRALYEAGFRHGSVSSPQRLMPEYRAVWMGACPYAHYAHQSFRLVPGDLDFYEVPITVDPSRRRWQGKSAAEFRIEWYDAAGHRRTIDAALADMLARDVPVMTLCSITHNMFNYAEPANETRRSMIAAAEQLWQAAAACGLTLRPVTLSELHEIADRTPAARTVPWPR